jgi:hypothetical protein
MSQFELAPAKKIGSDQQWFALRQEPPFAPKTTRSEPQARGRADAQTRTVSGRGFKSGERVEPSTIFFTVTVNSRTLCRRPTPSATRHEHNQLSCRMSDALPLRPNSPSCPDLLRTSLHVHTRKSDSFLQSSKAAECTVQNEAANRRFS